MSVAGGNLPVVNRTDRLYALVEELRAMAPRPRSARQLAARYEVSTRTIERDILALQESGVPVYAETGRHGGYVVDKRLTLPPVNFTAAEMVAIAVSLAWAEGTPFAFAARSALRKVLAVAPAGQTAEAAELADRIRLIKAGPSVKNGPRPSRAQAHPIVPLSVQEAITARHVLLLDYRDGRDAVTVREVEPVAFAGTRDHWYLLAWCRLRDGARAFRVDRILAAVDTGEPAPHRSYADLDVDIPDVLVRAPELPGWPKAQRECPGYRHNPHHAKEIDMTDATSPALQTALAYYQAWTSHDLDKAMSYVADGIVCDAPAGRLEGADAYRGFLGPFVQITTGAKMIAAFGDDETALVMYDTQTVPVSSAPGAEYVTVKDGKITYSRFVFDRAPFDAARNPAS
jgi:predicted DNA-binding transcriptional regulator YafY